MPIDEPYVAVLQGMENGERVIYGEPKVIASSTFVEDAKAEALRWAAELQSRVGKTATMILTKGSAGITSHTFKDDLAN